jgi:hypothetical protein
MTISVLAYFLFSFSCPHGQLKENLYEMPTLMYSLEVLLPTKPYTCIDKLEIFLEKKYAKTDIVIT